MATYTLNGVRYSSKEAVSDHAKAIKDKHRPGEFLEGDELDFMLELLLWHPDAATKIGVGIRHLMVRANPQFGHNEFYLIRTDGSATEFSYKQCVQPKTAEAEFKTACRVAIAPDVIAFGQAYFAETRFSKCPLTGEEMTSANAHIDHTPPTTFSALLSAFVKLHGIVPALVELTGKHEDNSFRLQIADEELRNAWIAYHRQYARLRVISEQANLNIVGKEWDNILDYLNYTSHPDALVEWKGKQRFFTHYPGMVRGVLAGAERAPEGTPVIDGTLAVLEVSTMTDEEREAMTV